MQVKNVQAGHTRAVIGPLDLGDESVLRVQLLSAENGSLLASADKPVPGTPDWELEVADACSALVMIGVQTLSVAQGFDCDGTPQDVSAYHA